MIFLGHILYAAIKYLEYEDFARRRVNSTLSVIAFFNSYVNLSPFSKEII